MRVLYNSCMSRRCIKCQELKSENDFYLPRSKTCKGCRIQYIKEWQRNNREKFNATRRRYYRNNKRKINQYAFQWRRKRYDWFIKYKQTHPCERCGQSDYRCLEFHHPEGRKESNLSVGSMINHRKETLLEEMKRCQILCANCHKIIHFLA